MIKASELRIGNLVTDEFYNLYDGKFNTIITVESIDNHGINLYLDNDGDIVELMDSWIEPLITFEKLFGIPLTEEWLNKFGFKHITGDDVWNEYKLSEFEEVWHSGNGYFIEKDSDTFKLYQHTDEDTYTQLKWLDYVHNFQNLLLRQLWFESI